MNKQGAPVTIGLLVALVVSFLAAWFTAGAPMPFLALAPGTFLPWTLVTYPFADAGDGRNLFWFLITLLWFYWVGTSLERDLGTRKYVLVLLAMTLLPALFVGFGAFAFGRPVILAGTNLPLSGLTVAWGVRNAGAQVRLYGIIPVTGAIIAGLTVLLVFFGYGTGSPIVGVLAVLHLGIAFLFATNRIPGFTYSKPVYVDKPSKAERERESQYFEEVRKREQERVERERLRRLLEGTGPDEPDR